MQLRDAYDGSRIARRDQLPIHNQRRLFQPDPGYAVRRFERQGDRRVQERLKRLRRSQPAVVWAGAALCSQLEHPLERPLCPFAHLLWKLDFVAQMTK